MNATQIIEALENEAKTLGMAAAQYQALRAFAIYQAENGKEWDANDEAEDAAQAAYEEAARAFAEAKAKLVGAQDVYVCCGFAVDGAINAVEFDAVYTGKGGRMFKVATYDAMTNRLTYC